MSKNPETNWPVVSPDNMNMNWPTAIFLCVVVVTGVVFLTIGMLSNAEHLRQQSKTEVLQNNN